MAASRNTVTVDYEQRDFEDFCPKISYAKYLDKVGRLYNIDSQNNFIKSLTNDESYKFFELLYSRNVTPLSMEVYFKTAKPTLGKFKLYVEILSYKNVEIFEKFLDLAASQSDKVFTNCTNNCLVNRKLCESCRELISLVYIRANKNRIHSSRSMSFRVHREGDIIKNLCLHLEQYMDKNMLEKYKPKSRNSECCIM